MALAMPALVWAQAFPSRAITIVVPNPPGGLVDTSARLAGDALAKVMGQPVLVENKPGPSGTPAYQRVAHGARDGYTLLASYSGYHVASPLLQDRLPWKLRDLTPVGMVTVATNVIAIHPSVPAGSLKEFIVWARANPERLSYASQGNGSVSHIGTEVFKMQTGVQMDHVPYKGSGQAIADVLAGKVPVFISTPPSMLQHVQNGKLRALAVAGKSRLPSLPQVPTTAEAGLPGFELASWVALYAPAGTPAAIVDRLSSDLRRALEMPEARQRAHAAGIEVRWLPPADTTRVLEHDIAEFSKSIKAANIRPD